MKELQLKKEHADLLTRNKKLQKKKSEKELELQMFKLKVTKILAKM